MCSHHNNNNKLKFQKEGQFYKNLREQINLYFKSNPVDKFANTKWFAKAGIMIGTYILVYSILLMYGEQRILFYGTYAVMGILAVLIGLNVGHDAAHGTISRNKLVNKIFLMVFDLLGANSYIWKLRHVHAHHPYPNVAGHDADIQQTKVVRIFPTDKLRPFHKFQHIYSPMLFVLVYTLNWMMIRDFKDFKMKIFGAKVVKEHSKIEFVKLAFFKIFYLILVVGIPAIVLGFSFWKMLTGFLVLNISAGVVVSMALVSTHVGDHQEFPMPDKQGFLPYSWAEHQMATTSDFCTGSFLFNNLFGGFNHHVIHHLFPNVNHIHYPKLTPILINVAKENNMAYHVEQDFYKVFTAHINLLKREGWQSWNEQLNRRFD